MTAVQVYREKLLALADWIPYLLAESRLPGPRGNLELVEAAADLATPEQIEQFLRFSPPDDSTNIPEVFPVVCSVVALGRLLAEGRAAVLPQVRAFANDPRWRVREAAAMALQRWGDADMDAVVAAILPWAEGSFLEQRAAIAALCEPRLLAAPQHARAAFDLLDRVTTNLAQSHERKSDDFRVLRQALGYCWSVAVAALPDEGLPRFDRWRTSPDNDVAWVVKENLKKNRLKKVIEGA